MSSTSLVTLHFERQLERRGYPTHDIRWSLGYCQGDGMAFYGRVDAQACADRLLRGKVRAAAKRAIGKATASLTITRNSYGNHYSHFNTMEVALETYSDTMTKLEASALADLEQAIELDMRKISKELEAEGYRILEAGDPNWWHHISGDSKGVRHRAFSRRNFNVEIWVRPDRDFNAEHWAPECRDDLLADLAAGKQVYFGIEAIVTSSDGTRLGDASCWAYTEWSPKHKPEVWKNPAQFVHNEMRTLIADACNCARERLAHLRLRGPLAA